MRCSGADGTLYVKPSGDGDRILASHSASSALRLGDDPSNYQAVTIVTCNIDAPLASLSDAQLVLSVGKVFNTNPIGNWGGKVIVDVVRAVV